MGLLILEDTTMTDGTATHRARSCWFVGAVYDGNDDQMPRFTVLGPGEFRVECVDAKSVVDLFRALS